MQKSADAIDTIVRSVADLRALQRYLVEVVELQQYEPELRTYPAAAGVLLEIGEVAGAHVVSLDAHLASLGAGAQVVRQSTAMVAGAFLGFISKLRSHHASHILRDDFTLLNLIAVSYEMLRSSALVLGEKTTAKIATDHSAAYAPLQRQLNHLLPQVAVHDLSRNFVGLNTEELEAALGQPRENVVRSSLYAATA